MIFYIDENDVATRSPTPGWHGENVDDDDDDYGTRMLESLPQQ